MDIAGIGSLNIADFANLQFEAASMRKAEADLRANQSFAERLMAANTEEAVPVYYGKDSGIDKSSELFGLCRELETFLLKNLITGMRNTVTKSGFMDIGFAGRFYEDMLWDEYTKSFAENAGLGFAEMAYRELNRKAQSQGLIADFI